MPAKITIKRALLSVSDKTGLVAFANRLAQHGVQLISTGGTAAVLEGAGLQVTTVDQVTGFPEMLDGRVKTLHPKIHGALLARRDKPDHVAAMRGAGMEPIDLVCVNLYPFEQTICRNGVTVDEAIEQIDIGGPSMIRSAAKNHASVTVVTDPSQYDQVCNDIDEHRGATSPALRHRLSTAAFARTAAYDNAVAAWMTRQEPQETESAKSEFPMMFMLSFNRQAELRYGENPHQTGALYTCPASTEPSVASARKLHGKELSFCNLYDANGALELVKEVDANEHAAAAVIKHANPCGFALASDLADAFIQAYQGDPLAAFGGIVACNRCADVHTAERIAAVDGFLDVIVAPEFEEAATQLLRKRWKNTRLLEVGPLASRQNQPPNQLDFKQIIGGLLVQQSDLAPFDPRQWQHVGGPPPTDQ
ncbi:MAG: bifunctional phosphoribosylaminoimidazolecarboxamide formyltransferase/IMP cyclohydrolase, partial [Pirellulaceae bacterium]|nr:bifunctional phosphoribosylaminoimidazolecarboxamide formyltransferase/IMP cyclohydrolase [Pirellulaceae bacterium]